jgi:hypothetical protein
MDGVTDGRGPQWSWLDVYRSGAHMETCIHGTIEQVPPHDIGGPAPPPVDQAGATKAQDIQSSSWSGSGSSDGDTQDNAATVGLTASGGTGLAATSRTVTAVPPWCNAAPVNIWDAEKVSHPGSGECSMSAMLQQPLLSCF